jgi:hypothetical protein
MVRLAHTMHLSCVKISTISKWIEMSFQLSLVTWEYHRVCLKQFLSLWYVWCKPWHYLAPTLTASTNGPNQDSIGPTSPRSSIECIQNNFWAYGTLAANHAPILRQGLHYLQIDRNEIPHDPHHQGVPSSTSKMISEPMVRSVETVYWSCIKINTFSKWTETSF